MTTLTEKRAERIRRQFIDLINHRAERLAPKALSLVEQAPPKRVWNDAGYCDSVPHGLPQRLHRLMEYVESELDDIERQMARRGWMPYEDDEDTSAGTLATSTPEEDNR